MKDLFYLEPESAKILLHLVKLAKLEKPNEDYPAIKIDNTRNSTTEESTYMPVCVEIIDYPLKGTYIVSVAQYGESNGDAMRDPEVCFIIDEDNRCQPISFRNDWVGVDKEYICYENFKAINKEEIPQLIEFVGIWLQNIEEQQELIIT